MLKTMGQMYASSREGAKVGRMLSEEKEVLWSSASKDAVKRDTLVRTVKTT